VAVSTHVLLGQAVAQPVARCRHELDVPAGEPDLLLELAIQSLLRRFVLAHATLGKLPSAPTRATPQKNLAVIANQYDPDIGAKPICIDEVAHGRPEKRISADCSTSLRRQPPGRAAWTVAVGTVT